MRRGMVTKGTREILRVERPKPGVYEWHLRCGHVMHVKQPPRDAQRSAVCETCRGRPANASRSRGRWKAAPGQSDGGSGGRE